MPTESTYTSRGGSASAAARLSILTWHVHGNYLYYLSQVPHDFYIVTKPGHPPGYAGRVGALPWGDNVHEVLYDEVMRGEFDCVIYQQRSHYEEDRWTILSAAQRSLPQVYIEHDPPQESPTEQRHWVQDIDAMLIHVTHFNALMWNSGITPFRVIEHGVLVPPGIAYSGELERGVTAINHLKQRGRRLGHDVFDAVRKQIPIDLVGMDAQAAGGIGEIANPELAAFCARYRFFFNPIRYTSLGLAVVEAMMIGMPVVALATTELPSVIENGVNGYIDSDPRALVAAMKQLLAEPALARRWGDTARQTALERFGIGRFVDDWLTTLRDACARDGGAEQGRRQ